MRARLLVQAALLAVPLVGGIGAALSACVGTNADQTFLCPSETVFIGLAADGGKLPGAAVSEYMDRRCGTLDCHGSEARPMRLYGRLGLRAPEQNNRSGGAPTTLLELKANYGAVCSIEPEKTDKAVMDMGASAEKLLVVLKARGTEAHKGGIVVMAGSNGDECITGWLKGDPPATVAAACKIALDNL